MAKTIKVEFGVPQYSIDNSRINYKDWVDYHKGKAFEEMRAEAKDLIEWNEQPTKMGVEFSGTIVMMPESELRDVLVKLKTLRSTIHSRILIDMVNDIMQTLNP